jgi:hypothetical protein
MYGPAVAKFVHLHFSRAGEKIIEYGPAVAKFVDLHVSRVGEKIIEPPAATNE